MIFYNLIKRILLRIKIFFYKNLIDQALFVWRKIDVLLYGPYNIEFNFFFLLFGKFMAHASDNYFFTGLIKPFKALIARAVPVNPEYNWHPANILYKDFNYTDKSKRYNIPRDVFYLGLLNRAYVILRRKFYLDLKIQIVSILFFIFVNMSFYQTIIVNISPISSILFSYLIAVIITPIVVVLVCRLNFERYKKTCIGLKLAIFKPLYLNPKLRKFSSEIAFDFRWIDFWLNKEKHIQDTVQEVFSNLELGNLDNMKKKELNQRSRKDFCVGILKVFFISLMLFLFFHDKFYFFFFLFFFVIFMYFLSRIEKLRYPYSTTLTSFETHKFFPSVGYLYPSNSRYINNIVSSFNLNTVHKNAVKEKMQHDVTYVELLKLVDGLSALAFLLINTKDTKFADKFMSSPETDKKVKFKDLYMHIDEEIEDKKDSKKEDEGVPYLYELATGLKELEDEMKLKFDFLNELPFDPFMSLVELRTSAKNLLEEIKKTTDEVRFLRKSSKSKSLNRHDLDLELESLGFKINGDEHITLREYYKNKKQLLKKLLKLVFLKIRLRFLRRTVFLSIKQLQKDLKALVLYRYSKDLRIKNLSEILHVKHYDDWFRINYVWKLWDFANPVYYFVFLFTIPYNSLKWEIGNFNFLGTSFSYFKLVKCKTHNLDVSFKLDLSNLNHYKYLKDNSKDDFLKVLYPYSYHDKILFKGFVKVSIGQDKKVKFTKLF